MNTVELLMRECNNYFFKWKEVGTFTIADNKISGFKGNYLVGQYIRLKGSILNDGVYKIESISNNQITVTGLNNEVFEGVIFGLSVPKDFVELSSKIDDHIKTVPKNANKVSESFNNYSISYATGSSGKVLEWQTIFSDSLKDYRNVYDGERRVKQI